MKYHIKGENIDFICEGKKAIGKVWDPVMGTLEFEITYNEDCSARSGTLKHGLLKLILKDKRTKVTDEYVQYEGEVSSNLGFHQTTCYRLYRDSYVEVPSGGEGSIKGKATITPRFSEEDWARLRGIPLPDL